MQTNEWNVSVDGFEAPIDLGHTLLGSKLAVQCGGARSQSWGGGCRRHGMEDTSAQKSKRCPQGVVAEDQALEICGLPPGLLASCFTLLWAFYSALCPPLLISPEKSSSEDEFKTKQPVWKTRCFILILPRKIWCKPSCQEALCDSQIWRLPAARSARKGGSWRMYMQLSHLGEVHTEAEAQLGSKRWQEQTGGTTAVVSKDSVQPMTPLAWPKWPTSHPLHLLGEMRGF